VKRPSKEPNVHQFVLGYWASHGYGPSYREIAQGTEMKSLNAVKLHLNSLIRKGVLARQAGMARTIRPVRQQESVT
jgi:repressor LexA